MYNRSPSATAQPIRTKWYALGPSSHKKCWPT
uniref:Uncharacterized protein n=1 Tax=Rhizophora mucronata TaxID=61149 RepID=A0A2P2L3Y6_RHIMU